MSRIWNNKDIEEKGFTLIIFILLIFLISGGIIGGSFYIKNNHPEWVSKKIAKIPNNSTQNNSSSSKIQNEAISGSKVQVIGKKPELILQAPLMCNDSEGNYFDVEGYGQIQVCFREGITCNKANISGSLRKINIDCPDQNPVKCGEWIIIDAQDVKCLIN
ncbi:MAG: hypothetical protein Q7R97_04520 [Candidatus Daviesbacteria bacterium]|nr:hypothetical protein [Candidatus Daviesbacteria bacterium]